MTSIKINDIFEDLFEENKRLLNELSFAKKFLNILNEFNTFIDLISHKFKSNLDENQFKKYNELNDNIKGFRFVLKSKQNALINGKIDLQICDNYSSNNWLTNETKDESPPERLTTSEAKKRSTNSTDSSSDNEISKRHKRQHQRNEELEVKSEEFTTDNGNIHSNESESDSDFYANASDNQSSDDSRDEDYGRQTKKKSTKSVAEKRQLETTEEQIDGKFVCSDCGKLFKFKFNLNAHRRRIHQLSDTLLVCEVDGCRKEFKTKQSKKDHYSNYHIDQYFCDYPGCEFKTGKQAFLDKHLITHSDERPFVCQTCNKTYKNQTYLEQHERTVHSDERPFVCETCNKSYKTKYMLKEHQLSVHRSSIGDDEQDNQFVCTDCKKSFSTKRRLKRHIKRVHELKDNSGVKLHRYQSHNATRKYVCTHPGCQFKAKRPSHLDSHLITHSDERPFVCQTCNKAFKTHGYLVTHERIVHSSAPRVKCPVDGCDRYFKSKNSAKTHSKIMHSDAVYHCPWPGCEHTSRNPSLMKAHESVHSSEANFVCDWPQCGKRFKRKSYLTDHLRVHTNDKKFTCNWPGCDYRCTNSGNLHYHINTTHKRV